ncbi:hypothetical protein K661_00637 [Piscirickettsia salmonis LF-89 = ATCC VR-1361]|nr:hypothetical protein K661_00637 [Piscirickettsia salmonis LF-89 = ATCC VR-1361]
MNEITSPAGYFFCFFSYSSFADINTVKLIFLHASSTLTAEYNE